MLTYLIILLDDTSVSFCHYDVPEGERRLMPLDVLRRGIVWAMKENVNVQFVYPDYPLPQEYNELIETIDHTKIKPEAQAEGADVAVLTEWKSRIADSADHATCIIHASRQELAVNMGKVKLLIGKAARVNVVLTDTEVFTDKDADSYKQTLDAMADRIIELYLQGGNPQLNILTDRLSIGHMNNCGAGDTSLTLAPDGKLYVCPAFYYDKQEAIGDVESGVKIGNAQLLHLDHAPICSHCDAFQCKRCIWLNQKTTLEVNTPSHEQCVAAHLERNASKPLLEHLRSHGNFFPKTADINEIDFLDPFENKDKWQ